MTKNTTIHNKYKEPYDVYIGRPTIYGNPFTIGKDGTRDDVVEKYKTFFIEKILNDNDFKNKILTLKGKRLGCFCKPLKCHGDIICEYLNSV
jgi:hypothetical protein